MTALFADRNQPTLQVCRVGKHYQVKRRRVEAVSDVSFGVSAGEICVLLGPSGCGKSTLLRMVAGLETRSSGDIRLNGCSVSGPGRDRGMVFQSYTSYPWLTVRQNVEFGLRVTRRVETMREGPADYFIERVGLSRFRDAFPDQLSGGMRQRVALARTLANGPELLLMDEPFGALDAETRWQMQELLLEVACKERMTVLMVTHDVEEALYLADSIVFLSSHPGRVREVMRPALRQAGVFSAKETVIEHPDYPVHHKQLLAMMRDEGGADAA